MKNNLESKTENNRKNKLNAILCPIATAIIGLSGATNIAEALQYLGEKITTPGMQEYIGKIGSGVIEYGWAAMGFLSALCFTGIATKATYEYFVNK